MIKEIEQSSDRQDLNELQSVAMNIIQNDTQMLQLEMNNKEELIENQEESADDDDNQDTISDAGSNLLKNKNIKLQSLDSQRLDEIRNFIGSFESRLISAKESVELINDQLPTLEEIVKGIAGLNQFNTIPQVNANIMIASTKVRKLIKRFIDIMDNFKMILILEQKTAQLALEKLSKLEEEKKMKDNQFKSNSKTIDVPEDLPTGSWKKDSKIVQFLKQQNDQKKLQGFVGRLGDLASIDQKYDCAISTACVPLDFIVVDSIANAQSSVEAVKKQDFGSISFIALENMILDSKDCCPLTDGTPENVPRLFDLIQIKNEQIRPAFRFALGDTLVANDLEQATRIAFGNGSKRQWRVVTLDGQLVDPFNGMSADDRPLKGRMMTTSTTTGGYVQEELELWKIKAQQIKGQYEQFRNQIELLAQKIDLLKNSLPPSPLDDILFLFLLLFFVLFRVLAFNNIFPCSDHDYDDDMC